MQVIGEKRKLTFQEKTNRKYSYKQCTGNTYLQNKSMTIPPVKTQYLTQRQHMSTSVK